MYDDIYALFENLDTSVLTRDRKCPTTYSTPFRKYIVNDTDNYLLISDKSVWFTHVQNYMIKEHFEMSIFGEIKYFKYAWDGEWIQTDEHFWVPGGCTEEEFFQKSLLKNVPHTYEDNVRLSMMYQKYSYHDHLSWDILDSTK